MRDIVNLLLYLLYRRRSTTTQESTLLLDARLREGSSGLSEKLESTLLQKDHYSSATVNHLIYFSPSEIKPSFITISKKKKKKKKLVIPFKQSRFKESIFKRKGFTEGINEERTDDLTLIVI